MSWLSNVWNSITGNNQQQAQQQMIALQQQMYQQQVQQAAAAKAQMEADEAQRQSNIRGGVSAIDQAFAKFNDPSFYDTASKNYSDYYIPQIDREAALTKDKLIASLFDRGMLESTVGANTLGELENRRLNERARIGNEATDFSNDIRNKVTSSRNSLYDVARSAADPSAVAARATGEATTLAQAPGGYTSKGAGLGHVFATMLEPLDAAVKRKQNRLPRETPAPWETSPSTGGGGSLRLFG